MNIFILDEEPRRCAQYHNDKHVVKMIVESVQLLSTAARLSGINAGYAITHRNHPCNIWVRESLDNWLWLEELAYYLEAEWKYRYNHCPGRRHKSMQMLENIRPIPDLPDIGLTPFALAMPDEYKTNNTVDSYREYYRKEKQHIGAWRKRGQPDWW